MSFEFAADSELSPLMTGNPVKGDHKVQQQNMLEREILPGVLKHALQQIC